MPVTRSEMLFFTAGVVAGAFGHAAYPKLKEKIGPLIDAATAGAGNGFADSYADVVRTVAERVEAVQDAMMSQPHAHRNGQAASPVSA